MATKHRILCINKQDRFNPHERITHIGGQNSNGENWKITQLEAIESIEAGKWAFYVQDRVGNQADVIVSTSRYGHKYITTVADGETQNNLLSLYECR